MCSPYQSKNKEEKEEKQNTIKKERKRK